MWLLALLLSLFSGDDVPPPENVEAPPLENEEQPNVFNAPDITSVPTPIPDYASHLDSTEAIEDEDKYEYPLFSMSSPNDFFKKAWRSIVGILGLTPADGDYHFLSKVNCLIQSVNLSANKSQRMTTIFQKKTESISPAVLLITERYDDYTVVGLYNEFDESRSAYIKVMDNDWNAFVQLFEALFLIFYQNYLFLTEMNQNKRALLHENLQSAYEDLLDADKTLWEAQNDLYCANNDTSYMSLEEATENLRLAETAIDKINEDFIYARKKVYKAESEYTQAVRFSLLNPFILLSISFNPISAAVAS